MGQLAVLQMTIVLCIMVSAVAYVSTYDVPTDPHARIERILETKGEDLMSILVDTPVTDPCSGRSELERLVIDGVNGEHARWKDRISTRYPPGFESNLWLYNRHAYYPLHVREDFKGTTATRHLYPDWTWTKGIPSVETVSGLEHHDVQAYGLSMGRPMWLQGEAVEVGVDWTSVAGARDTRVWSLTALAPPTPEFPRDGAATTMTWKMGTPATPTANTTLDLTKVGPTKAAIPFKIALDTPSGGVAPGTDVEFRLPDDWIIDGIITSGWAFEPPAGSRANITAQDSPAGEVTINARRPTLPTLPFEVFTAQASNGSRSVANLVVSYTGLADRSLPRLAYPTVPYPVVTSEPATFGVAFANGGEDVTVHHVNFTIPGGYDLRHNDGQGAGVFGDVIQGIQPENGTWEISSDGRQISWSGEVDVDAGKAASWLARVQTTSDASRASSIESVRSPGPVANASFSNMFATNSSQWGAAPGIVRLRVPPASVPYTLDESGSNDGYPWSAAAELKGTQLSYDLRMQDARGVAEARSAYRIGATAGDVTKLQSSVANSSFRVEERMVPVGQELVVRGEMESILTTLAQAGVEDAQLTVELYAPPSMGCTPTASVTRSVASLPAAGVTGLLVWNDLVDPGIVVGTGDKRVSFLREDGERAWFQALGGSASHLVRADFGVLSGSWLVVGDSMGGVTLLDPATGEIEWSYDAGASIAALDVRASPPRILAATASGITLLDETGAEVAGALLAGPVQDARFAPDGRVLVLGSSFLTRRSASLDEEQMMPLADSPVGFAVGDHVVVSTAYATRVLRVSDFGAIAIYDHVSLVQRAASGDVTGDGRADLFIGFLNMSVAVIDSAEGGIRYHSLENAMPTNANLPVGLFSSPDSQLACLAVGQTTYSFDCEVRAVSESILDLAAGGGRAVAYFSTGSGYSILQTFDGTQEVAASYVWEQDGSVAVGDWTLGHRGALGTSGGWVSQFDPDETGSEPFSRVRPSDRIGDFQLRFLVPEGGFYGTHLLVARLSWQDASGVEQGANLVDWFEAVGVDGKPVLHPAYSIVLVTRDRTSTGT